jgi:uncharacterized protein (TIRG00374 family)
LLFAANDENAVIMLSCAKGFGEIFYAFREGVMRKKINAKMIYNFIITLFVVGLFIYFCFSENGLIDLSKNAKQFKKSWLIIAVLFHFVNLSIDAFLIYLFVFNGEKNYSIKNAIKASLVGQFFNSVTPSASGGQPMQVYVMSKQGVGAGHSTAALIQKFLLYQNVLVGYCIFAFFIKFDYFIALDSRVRIWAIFGFIIQSLMVFALLFFSFNEKMTMRFIFMIFSLLGKLRIVKNPDEKVQGLQKQLKAFHDSNRDLYKNKSLLVKTYIFTIIQMTATFLIPYCIYKSFNLCGATLLDIVCVQAFITMSTAFFPIPGASGATEGAGMIFLNDFFTKTTIKPAVVMTRFISYYLTILISFPSSRMKKDKKILENLKP